MVKNFDTRSVIAITLVLSMIAMALVLGYNSPDSDTFKIVVGGLMTVGFSSIISFYFGSSSGSKAKDDTLNQIAANATTSGPSGSSPVSTTTTVEPGKTVTEVQPAPVLVPTPTTSTTSIAPAQPAPASGPIQ